MQDLGYRGRELPLSSLVDDIRRAAKSTAVPMIGVDGRAGAGKTTLCDALARIDPAISVVHTDDFYVPAGERTSPEEEAGRQIDWRRIVDQVVVPLSEGRAGRYQRFDWDEQRLMKWEEAPTSGIVLLDGVYSTREEIAPYLALRIWVEAAHEVSLPRAIARDGEASEEWWMEDWVEDEDRYVLVDDPEARADIVIDGSASLYSRGWYRRLR